MRWFLVLPLVAIGACTTQDIEATHSKARFSSYPRDLLAAFEAACTGPAQTFSAPSPDLVECREFLPPEPTAAIILNYGGTPEDLPELVIRFRTRQDVPGYVVENDVFLNVPQKSGREIQVRHYDTRLHRTLEELYERAGGVPE